MPESRIPELLIREKHIKGLIASLELSYDRKRKGVKYQTLLSSYMSQLVAVSNRISNLGKKHNLIEVKVTYQELIGRGLSKDATGIVYLTEISKDDARHVMKDYYPGLKVKSLKEIALKVVLPLRY